MNHDSVLTHFCTRTLAVSLAPHPRGITVFTIPFYHYSDHRKNRYNQTLKSTVPTQQIDNPTVIID